jgi:hypothetical protein
VALGALKPGRVALIGSALLLAAPTACETRDVFLVPKGVSAGTGGNIIVLPGADGGKKRPAHADSSMEPDASPEADSGADATSMACETTRNPQVPQPLGVYVLVDQSYAMLSQWDSVSAALKTFIGGGDELGGVSMGIQYYAISPPPPIPPVPPDPPVLTEPYLTMACKSDSYVDPDVDILPLPMNQDAIIGSLTDHGPTSLKQFLDKLGLTLTFAATESPIDAAIQGAIEGARTWASNWTKDHPMSNPAAAVLLVTNQIATATESPTCMPTREKAMAAAAAGFSGNPSIPTYVLAVGGPSSDLNDIAFHGGTNSAHAVTNGVTLLDALIGIRKVVLPCDVKLSASEEQELAQGKLNVDLHDPNTGSSSRYGRVENALDCSETPGRGEWYVEGPGQDTKVKLCPSTCEAARRLLKATLDVVHGCPTTYIR